MRKLYLSFIALLTTCAGALAQNPVLETMGNPASSTAVGLYNGWTCTYYGQLSYTGTAMVQNTNPSVNTAPYYFASGGGNIRFNNTPGTYFQVAGFDQNYMDTHVGVWPANAYVWFAMSGYDSTNLNELVLSASTDSGQVWTTCSYSRGYSTAMGFPAAPWDVFYASLPLPSNFNKYMIKFTQGTSTKIFNIDDIEIHFVFVLSLKLIDFAGNTDGKKTSLKWTAVSSSEQEKFVLEKSTNGQMFAAIAEQPSKGAGEHTYEYTEATGSNTCYRLKMVEQNGQYAYSNIIRISGRNLEDNFIQMLYPVPAKDELHMQLNSPSAQQINLGIYDLSGRHILGKTLAMDKGVYDEVLDIGGLETGVYYIQVQGANISYVKSFAVKK